MDELFIMFKVNDSQKDHKINKTYGVSERFTAR